MGVNFDADHGTLDSCLKEMSNPSTYTGELELLALTLVKQLLSTQGTANKAASSGQCDALINYIQRLDCQS